MKINELLNTVNAYTWVKVIDEYGNLKDEDVAYIIKEKYGMINLRKYAITNIPTFSFIILL